MTDHDNTHDAQLEEIVAYLDGELSGEACARVERRLASDEDFRQQLQSVERAWTALDELPMTTVDDRFSRTTMSMVIEAAADELRSKTRALPIARRRRWMSTMLAGAVAAALGFLAFRLAWHDPNRMLVDDLAVIDNIDIYSQFHDVDFLRQLDGQLGDELAELSGDVQDLAARGERFATIAAQDAAAQWLRGLDDEQRTNLRAKFNRFRELPADEQDRLRKLHAEILAAPDASQLQKIMLTYQQWLGGLAPVRQFELRNLADSDARIALIEEWASDMRDDELLTLTSDELKQFFGALRRELVRLDDSRDRGDRRGDQMGDRALIATLLGKSWWGQELMREFARRGGRRDFYRAVLDALPQRSQARFDALPPAEKVERFRTWMRQYTVCQGEVTLEELERFFAEDLDAETRSQLLSLPPGEMENALRQMYRCPNRRNAPDRWTLETGGERRDGDGQPRRPGAAWGGPAGARFDGPPSVPPPKGFGGPRGRTFEEYGPTPPEGPRRGRRPSPPRD